jgi:hypothetical protein
VSENRTAFTAGERQFRATILVQIAQQQVMERQAHVGPRSAAHGAIQSAVDAPAPVRWFANIPKGTSEVVYAHDFNAGSAEIRLEKVPMP